MKFLLALLLGFMLLEPAKAGEQMPCHRQPGDEGTWHYRTNIAPQPDWRCYYQGPRMKPRKELYWLEVPALLPISDLPPWESWESETWRGAAPGWDQRE